MSSEEPKDARADEQAAGADKPERAAGQAPAGDAGHMEGAEDERMTILVAGSGADFSQNLVEYALWFAKRLEYDIVALSCVSGGRDAPKVLEPYTEELQKNFREEAAKGVELLAYRAATEDLPFKHLVLFGSQDHCIREACDQIGNVDYVISEPEDPPPHADMEHAMPVFSIRR
jgi:hypothetical protein